MPSSPRSNRSSENIALLRQRFLEGDDASFEELLGIYMPLLKFIAHKYCAEASERDDCLAEAWLGFLRAVRTYDARRGSMDSYVALVASHRVIDWYRRTTRSRDVPTPDLDEKEGMRGGDPAESEVADILAFASTLSEAECACFEKHQAGESLGTIAAELKMTKTAVSNALGRARRKLGKASS